jgi:hypothetical protein
MNASRPMGALITLDAFYSSSSTLQLDNEYQLDSGGLMTTTGSVPVVIVDGPTSPVNEWTSG